jgi:hypothetical protein
MVERNPGISQLFIVTPSLRHSVTPYHFYSSSTRTPAMQCQW